MPDWSYHSMFKPILFRLPVKRARSLTLGAIGLLSRMPGGPLIIKTMGHMEFHPILSGFLPGTGMEMKYPVGLSGSIDPKGTAHKALSQFGFGLIEIGPVTVKPVEQSGSAYLELRSEAIVYEAERSNEGLNYWVRRLNSKRGHSLPLLFRLRPMPGASSEEALEQLLLMIRTLKAEAASYSIDVLDEGWPLEQAVWLLHELRQLSVQEGMPPLMLYMPLHISMENLVVLRHSLWREELSFGPERKQAAGFGGIVLGDTLPSAEGFIEVGRAGLEQSAEQIRRIRRLWGDDIGVIASGGVHAPEDALLLYEAGANAVLLHSGFVYAGPGLPKRINEALIYEKVQSEPAPVTPSFWSGWGWMLLLGIAMTIGGLLAWLIAVTVVVLPYDVLFLGMGRQELDAVNRFLLRFMMHDRVTLAGTMISIGLLYSLLAWFGLRRGQHWAKTAVMVSGGVGFSSFFLYLGYGYFDPLHALVAGLLLPSYLLAMRTRDGLPSSEPVNLVNDRVWLRAQWGQCLFVILGFALAIGGLVIALVGVSFVFVPTDLLYLCMSAEQLASINERLLPLIAHDRAGFGGALFSNALAVLAASLWGIGEGRRWLWITLLLGGLPGFIAGLSIHFAIGYTSFIHLLPAYFALLLYVAGLVLLYPYMMRKPARQRRDYEIVRSGAIIEQADR